MSGGPSGDEPPHYQGHRSRLRRRLLEAGGEAVADYELLELLLFRTIPRRDVKPIAKALTEGGGKQMWSSARRGISKAGTPSPAPKQGGDFASRHLFRRTA